VADEEALNLLKQGPVAWNEQRKLGKFLDTDLGGADLSGADLREANLMQANLSRADLTVADLSRSNLFRANLIETDLIETDLIQANLTGADLRGANLSEAKLYETLFVDTGLTDVVGLDGCNHIGPSALDHRTLAKSGQPWRAGGGDHLSLGDRSLQSGAQVENRPKQGQQHNCSRNLRLMMEKVGPRGSDHNNRQQQCASLGQFWNNQQRRSREFCYTNGEVETVRVTPSAESRNPICRAHDLHEPLHSK
jgi:uncharacterized protein YjbI with pentapeptide repeats